MSREEADSKIASVTVYENRAQVHRVARVPLGAGVTSVVFGDIPRSVDRDSIQVGLRPLDDAAAPDTVALNGITFEQRDAASKKKADNDKTKAAVEELRASYEEKKQVLADQKFALTAQTEALADEAQMLATYFDSATMNRTNDAAETYEDVAHWQKLIDAKMANDADAVIRRRGLEKEIKELEEKAKALAEEHKEALKQLSALPEGPSIAVNNSAPLMLVHLESKTAVGEVEVLVSYMMTNASWRAAYDLRVNTKTGQATLTYHALVQQSSGEAWENVNLTMSTAKPAVSGRAPDLTRWYATVFNPAPRMRQGSKKSKGGDKMMSKRSSARNQDINDAMDEVEDDDDGDMSSDSDDNSASEPARFEQAEVDEAKTTLSFDVPHQHTVTSNNDPVRVSLTVVNLTPEITYATRPSVAELAYAIMKASNTSNFTVMPGDANVFVDGQFVTKTTLGRITPKSNFRVGIGQESTISVVYKNLKQEDSETGGMLSAKKRVREYHRQALVKNMRDEAIEVRVEHEVPTAEDSRIEVKVLQPVKGQGCAVENEGDGKIAVTLKLKAREEFKLPFIITVTYPQELAHLQGL